MRRAEDRAGVERGVANTNTLKLTRGFVRDGGAWDCDVRTPTRLADEPRVTLRLGRVHGDRIEPYASRGAADEPWVAWRLSEVSVSAHRVGGEAVSPDHVEAVRAAKAAWTRFDEDKILVALDGNGGDGVLRGWAMSADDSPTRVRLGYDPESGLRWV